MLEKSVKFIQSDIICLLKWATEINQIENQWEYFNLRKFGFQLFQVPSNFPDLMYVISWMDGVWWSYLGESDISALNRLYRIALCFLSVAATGFTTEEDLGFGTLIEIAVVGDRYSVL